MNTQAQAQTTATATTTTLARTSNRRGRCVAGLASLLVSASLLATVVGGFGAQADATLAQVLQVPVVPQVLATLQA